METGSHWRPQKCEKGGAIAGRLEVGSKLETTERLRPRKKDLKGKRYSGKITRHVRSMLSRPFLFFI